MTWCLFRSVQQILFSFDRVWILCSVQIDHIIKYLNDFVGIVVRFFENFQTSVFGIVSN